MPRPRLSAVHRVNRSPGVLADSGVLLGARIVIAQRPEPYGRCISWDIDGYRLSLRHRGHSERRSDHGKALLVKSKAAAALKGGLSVIICVGESESGVDRAPPGDIGRCGVARDIPFNQHSDRL